MHWVIQTDIRSEKGLESLCRALVTQRVTFSVHQLVPFTRELVPDMSPDGPVIAIGSIGMRHVAARKGWVPGVFDIEHIKHTDQVEGWGRTLLNHQAIVTKFGDVIPPADKFFIKPDGCNKLFAGMIAEKEPFLEWQKDVCTRGEESTGSGLRPESQVIVNPNLFRILREIRFWVVDGQIVTSSQYKLGDNVVYQCGCDPDALEYAEYRVKQYCPARAFVMDLALIEDGYRVLEINTINSAGFYEAEMDKFVYAIESMKGF